ncbi:hypothetical protein ACIRBX_37290 [Kitasatospora sp. NPDC096147]|uniref:hypothetical protein n=1 Tax=Kitasatospora sp. NPDC096147 TaxID=3364093 RepID=UPI00381F1477
MTVPSPDPFYKVAEVYSPSEDAWQLELRGPQNQLLMVALIPDEDPSEEPTLHYASPGPHTVVPYDVVRWYVDRVDEAIREIRAWMRLRPELVATVHRLQQEHYGGWIDDAGFPALLAGLRTAVPEADLAVVLAAGLGRAPDGTELSPAEVLALVLAVTGD